MLKVKVEPVEPTLYGKVSLPNNPLTIAGYQVFCNDDDHDEEKVVEEEEEEDQLTGGGDAEIEGADRMMTDCCRENDLLGVGSDSGVKDEDDINIRGYVENDVMVDNNIVEEHVVEDSMVLVSPVIQESSPSDIIQVPYMETGPTEVLVIEEGTELMVENRHVIGYPQMIMGDENREYLMSEEVGEPSETLIADTADERHLSEPTDLHFPQREHVVVERINYDLPIIQPNDTHYYHLHDDQHMEGTVQLNFNANEENEPSLQHGLNVNPDNITSTPIDEARNTIRLQAKAGLKYIRSGKKEIYSPDVQKRKKASKRGIDNQVESDRNKSKKKRKNEVSHPLIIDDKIATPKTHKTPGLGTQSISVSTIQANHPTISLLLAKKGLTELVGPISEPKKKRMLTTSTTNDSTPQKVKAKPTIALPKVKAVTLTAIRCPIQLPPVPLPRVVTDINESEQMILQVANKVLNDKLLTKKKILKIPKSPVQTKHSKNKKQNTTPPERLISSVPQVTSLSTNAGLKHEAVSGIKIVKEQSTESTHKESIQSITSAITQATINLTTPITVAVTDTIAITNLPSAKSASLISVPKLAKKKSLASQTTTSKTVPPTDRTLPFTNNQSVSSVRAPPVTSPLSITVSPTSPIDVSTFNNMATDSDPLVTSIQKKHQTVTTTLQARLAMKPKNELKTPETLADRYMKEWKPTGRFQCKLCLYSCVTHNFLFRHWVLNHCSLRPYMCGHCGLQSATRDGVTRHQTAKHRGLTRRIFIDNERQEELWNKFDEMFQGSGFVTELEREAQTTYPLEQVRNVQHLQNAIQLSHKLSREVDNSLNNEADICSGTILKIPKREKVTRKFREVILYSSDDQDLGSSQESADEDQEEEDEKAVLSRYYLKPEITTDAKCNINLQCTPMVEAMATTNISSPSLQDRRVIAIRNVDSAKWAHFKTGIPKLANIQLPKQGNTSRPGMAQTSIVSSQETGSPEGLLTVAFDDDHIAAQVNSTTMIAQSQSKEATHHEISKGEMKD